MKRSRKRRVAATNNKNFIVVSLYTKGNIYEKYAGNLIENLNKLNIPNDVVPVDIDYSVKRNVVLYKPVFLKEMMKKHNKILIWCDCDDGFKKPLNNIDINFDVGFVTNPVKGGVPYTGGIHVWNNTKHGLHKLDVWEYLCKWQGLSTYNDHKRFTWAIGPIKNKKKDGNAKIADMTGIFKGNWTINLNRK